MSAVDRVLERIDALGIRLHAENGRLRYRAPKGVMTPELRQAIKAQEIELIERLDRAELSHAQRRLWILHELDPSSAAYHVPLVYLCEGPLDAGALAAAFEYLEERHESLRTVFAADRGVPYQRLLPPAPSPVAVVDLSAAAEPGAAARARVREIVTRPLDLERRPPYRIEILKLAAERHVMALVIHHIAADGVSVAVLARELTEAYAATRAGRPPRLPPPGMRYRDYAAWQAAYLEGHEAAEHRRYWLRKLAPPLPRMDVPADRPRPQIASSAGREEQLFLDRALADGLKNICRERGATLYMGLLAAVKVLLHRYTGLDDIVVGSPVAGRVHPDAAPLVGVFINTLVLRDAITSDMSFARALAAVRRTVTEGLDHDAYPFDRLVHDLDVDRDPSRSPVVDVMVILQNQQTDSLALDGVKVTPLYEHTGTSKFDLTFNFHEGRDAISLGIEYRTDLFETARIRRMGAHFVTLVAGAVKDPDARIGALEILGREERDRVVHDWNRTARPLPLDRTVVDLFRERARLSAGAVAVMCGSDRLTYGELDRRSSRLAAHLRRRGAATGAIVAISLDRSADLLVGLLGILKSGATYLPLDPGYPAVRLAFLMRDSGARLLVTQAALAGTLPSGGATVVLVDSAEADDAAVEGEALIDPSAVAYVIYTSGSTGTPKGVEVTHRSLTNFLLSMAAEPGLDSGDVMLAVTSPSFDIAALELYLPLIAGAQVAIAAEDEVSDGERLMARLAASRPSVMQATPSTWRMLLAAGWQGAPDLKVLCGGERLPGLLAASLLRSTREVWNLYGPTETTIWSLVHRLDSVDEEADPPIGRPIANTTAYVLDRGGNPVPPGFPGELCLGGAGVARGYRGRPDLTAARFVPDPFSGAPGGRLYRTGDRAVHLGDGSLRFLGRDDHQVKVRGFRVEVGEVEAALLRDDSIAEAVVAAPEDASGDRLLVAYVVARPGARFDAAAVRMKLSGTLPLHLVPSLVVPLEALPLTPNGKVDRRALPPPGREATGTARESGPPRDAREQAVHDAWTAVLGLEAVGIHENFFDLGGHSLRATRAAHLLQAALGVDVGLVDIFKAPTIAALADRLRARAATAADRIQSAPSAPEAAAPSVLDPADVEPLTAEERQLLGES